MSLFQRLWRLVLSWFDWNPEVTRPILADVMKEDELKITDPEIRNPEVMCPRLAEFMKEEELKMTDNEDEALTIYKVPFREELNLTEEMIVRKVFGEPGQFEDKVVLLVGATGTGKTTLVNAMANYIMGVQWEDDFRFKIPVDDHLKNYITVYTFYPMDGSALPYKLTVIDTPGFGSPEGIKGDKTIAKQVEALFKMSQASGIDHLNCIGIVIESEPRCLAPVQEYILASILSIFDISQNIFTFLTFAEEQKPPVIKEIKNRVIAENDKYFKFNNSALFATKEENDESTAEVLWNMNFLSFQAFFSEFARVESVHFDLAKEVVEERNELQNLLDGLNKEFTKGLDKIEEIREEERRYMNKIQDCIGRLHHTALSPNPLLNLDLLEKLVDSEKETADDGWEQRIQYLEEAKSHAKIFLNKKHRLANIAKREELKIKEGDSEVISTYKLSMKEELRNPEKKIAKQSLGKPQQIREKVLLVVGATGAGKSTLINAMVNYIMGVTWEDDFRFKLAIDEPNVSSSKSQTKYITAYTFYPMEGSGLTFKFTIIDTPGFGDTEGLKRDRIITQQVKEFFSVPPPDGIDHIDGIGFVTQSSLARLTPTQEYIFVSVLSIFGKDLSNNIFMMVTFADGQKPPVLKAIEDAKIPNSGKYFKFNNSALFADNKANEESFDAMFWKMGFKSIEAFFADFEKAQSVCLDLTKEVLQEREQLQALLEGLNPQITMGLNKIEEMRKEEIVMQQREMEIETNKEFTYDVEIDIPRKIDISGQGRYTTTCLKCNFTCHADCSRADDGDKYKCCAMDSSKYCKVCPGHCYWDQHKNLPYLIEFETVIETRTSEDLKKKYETAQKGKLKVTDMLTKIDEFLENAHTNVLTMIQECQECLHRLDSIALKPNPLSSVEHLQLLIESEKQSARPGWQRRIQYYEEAKRHAEMLSKVKDVKTAEKKIKGTKLSGDKWYSRFKFW